MTKTKTKKKGEVEGVIESAVGAAEELGQAAALFKESWKHIKRAQSKGTPAARAMGRVGKRASKIVRKGAKATYRGAKRAVTRRK